MLVCLTYFVQRDHHVGSIRLGKLKDTVFRTTNLSGKDETLVVVKGVLYTASAASNCLSILLQGRSAMQIGKRRSVWQCGQLSEKASH